MKTIKYLVVPDGFSYWSKLWKILELKTETSETNKSQPPLNSIGYVAPGPVQRSIFRANFPFA